MGILDGKRILVAGVTMDSSIGFATAQGRAGAGRDRADLQLRPRARHHQADRQAAARPSRRCSSSTSPTPSTSSGCRTLVREHVDGLDGVVHSIAYGNPETLLGGKFLDGPWDDVAQAVQVSAYSLKSLATACRPLMGPGGSIVGLTFDATVAWPAYDWMGVAKAGPGVHARATWPATSARTASGATWSAAGPLQDARRQGDPRLRGPRVACGATRAPLGWDETDHDADRQGGVRAALRLLPGDDRARSSTSTAASTRWGPER